MVHPRGVKHGAKLQVKVQDKTASAAESSGKIRATKVIVAAGAATLAAAAEAAAAVVAAAEKLRGFEMAEEEAARCADDNAFGPIAGASEMLLLSLQEEDNDEDEDEDEDEGGREKSNGRGKGRKLRRRRRGDHGAVVMTTPSAMLGGGDEKEEEKQEKEGVIVGERNKKDKEENSDPKDWRTMAAIRLRQELSEWNNGHRVGAFLTEADDADESAGIGQRTLPDARDASMLRLLIFLVSAGGAIRLLYVCMKYFFSLVYIFCG